MSSAKNKLQEYFQKQQLPLPVYTDRQENITLIWHSTAILYDGRTASGKAQTKTGAQQSAAENALKLIKQVRKQNAVYIDRSTSDESIAERLANPPTTRLRSFKSKSDENIIERLMNPSINKPTNPILPFRSTSTPPSITYNEDTQIFDVPTALFIDLENLPKLVDELPSTLGLDIYVFVGEHHPLVDKEFTRPIIRIISPSTRKDGTDTCMQVYIGMLLAQQKYEEYIIATMDHYGSTLVEMIQSNSLGWVPKSARLITRAKQL